MNNSMRALTLSIVCAIATSLLIVAFALYAFILSPASFSSDYAYNKRTTLPALARAVDEAILSKRNNVNALFSRVDMLAILQERVIKTQTPGSAQALLRAVEEDPSLYAIALYTPSGMPLFATKDAIDTRTPLTKHAWFRNFAERQSRTTTLIVDTDDYARFIRAIDNGKGDIVGYAVFSYYPATLLERYTPSRRGALSESFYCMKNAVVFMSPWANSAFFDKNVMERFLTPLAENATETPRLETMIYTANGKTVSALVMRLSYAPSVSIFLILTHVSALGNVFRYALLTLLALMLCFFIYAIMHARKTLKDNEDNPDDYDETPYDAASFEDDAPAFSDIHSFNEFDDRDVPPPFFDAPIPDFDAIDFDAPSIDERVTTAVEEESSVIENERYERANARAFDEFREDDSIVMLDGNELEKEENEYFASRDAFDIAHLDADFLCGETPERASAPPPPPPAWDVLNENPNAFAQRLKERKKRSAEDDRFEEKVIDHEIIIEQLETKPSFSSEPQDAEFEVPQIPDEYYEKPADAPSPELAELIDDVTDGELSKTELWKKIVRASSSFVGAHETFDSIVSTIETSFNVTVTKALFARYRHERHGYAATDAKGVSQETFSRFFIGEKDALFKAALSKGKPLFVKAQPFQSNALNAQFASEDKKGVTRLLIAPIKEGGMIFGFFVLLNIAHA